MKIDLWELQKLEEISIPSNPPDDNKNVMGNINMEESTKDGEKGSSRIECCLSKIEKLAIPARVAHCKVPICGSMTWECLFIAQMIDAEVAIYTKLVVQVPWVHVARL